MARVVILEGPDGSGKTTVARRLEQIGFKYRHEGPPPQGVDLIDHYHEILQESLSDAQDVVHDRLWLGERVYGPIMRDRDRLGPAGHVLFQRLMRSKLIIQYIFLPPFDLCKQNYIEKMKEKEDYVKDLDKWEKTYYKYVDLVNGLDRIYDYTLKTPHSILNDVMDPSLLEDLLPYGTIGSPKAKYLFIGDKSNHAYLDNPFFNTTNSSGYLNEAISLAGIKEEDLALTNAFMRDETPNKLALILSALPNLEHVFLLGATALNWFYKEIKPESVRDMKFEVYNIYHPAFLRRFKGHDPVYMASAIKEALDG